MYQHMLAVNLFLAWKDTIVMHENFFFFFFPRNFLLLSLPIPSLLNLRFFSGNFLEDDKNMWVFG